MSLRFAVPALLLTLSLSGCRTYGGHGSEAAVIGQLAAMPDWAAQELSRLAGDRRALEDAVAANPGLAPFVGRVTELSDELEHMAADWTDVTGGRNEASSYRDLQHLLGSMISDREGWQNAYRALARDVAVVAVGASNAPRAPSRYQVAPVHYERLASRLEDVRIRDLVASLR